MTETEEFEEKVQIDSMIRTIYADQALGLQRSQVNIAASNNQLKKITIDALAYIRLKKK